LEAFDSNNSSKRYIPLRKQKEFPKKWDSPSYEINKQTHRLKFTRHSKEKEIRWIKVRCLRDGVKIIQLPDVECLHNINTDSELVSVYKK
jgi:hypothetical protein